MRSLRRRRIPIAAFAGVFLLAAVVLTVANHAPRVPIARPAATRAVLRDAHWGPAIRTSGWTRSEVSAVDAGLERVSFFAGSRIVFDAALARGGRVTHANDYRGLHVAYGAPVLHRLPLLLLAGALFVLMTAVVPLRRLRNLDVVALASFVAPVVALDARLVEDSVLLACPALLYLAVRCAQRGLGRARAPAPATPLFTYLARGWTSARRLRLLRIGVGAAALVLVTTSVTASGAIDVGYAALAGATALLHGLLPYGHMPPDVVHGDTYPILTYLLYVPAAALAPVRDVWDDTTVALAMAAAAALATALALGRVVGGGGSTVRPRRTREADLGRAPVPREDALRAALAFLVFPPVMIAASTGTTDLLLAALVASALLCVARPGRSSALLAAAAWFKLVPVVLLPLWLAPRRGRALVRALGAIGAVSAASMLTVLAVGGTGGLGAMVHAVAFQFERGSLHSAWTALGLEALQPLAQAGVLALLAAGCLRLRRAPELASDPARMAALAGAILLGMQLAANYWAYLYLAWAFPCIALALLGPVRSRAPRILAARMVSVPGGPPSPPARVPAAVGS